MSAPARERFAASSDKQTKESPLLMTLAGAGGPRSARTKVESSRSSHAAFLSNTIIPLPPRTIGGIRDQTLKVKKCNCKRSGCLKLYCECFNAGIFCNDSCRCKSCQNIEFKGPIIAPADNKNGEAMTATPASASPNPSDTSTAKPSKKRSKRKKNDISDIDPYSDPRIEMIQTILDRNQHAFRPKATNITASQRGDEARGTVVTTLSQRPLMAHESRAKKTKLGCNCRKSFCLKKYCECFQAQLYCMATCRCTDCQNKVGNEKREKIIQKLRKKEEEKGSLALAAFAISGQGVAGDGMDKGGANSTVEKDHLYAEVPAVTNIGGVPAKTVAMVSAGIAAAGVDVFLPASNYAKPMVLKGLHSENDLTFDEIAFGMVGRQKVGGPSGPCANDKPSKCADANDDKSDEKNRSGSDSLQNDVKTQRTWVTEEIDLHHESFKSALAKMEVGTNNRQGRKSDPPTSASSSDIDNDASIGVWVGEAGKTHNVDQDIAARGTNEPTGLKSMSTDSLRRHRDQFAEETIIRIVKNLSGFKKQMEAADALAREKVDDYVREKQSQTQNADASEDGVLKDHDGSVKNTKNLPNENVKELCSLAAQDAILYRELARVFRQRALELAKIRNEKTKSTSIQI